jgi:PAS domain S-box-containing protein
VAPFLQFFQRLFDSDFMPHGNCFNWQPGILWLHVISDTAIALAYFSIPVTLFYFVKNRKGLGISALVVMFGAFITACGASHLMAVWDLWHSTYRLEGLIKAVTAGLSIATAIATMRLVPVARKIATPEEMERVNAELQAEIEARKEAERKLKELMARERADSENRLRSYLEAAAQAIVAVSADGTIQRVNRRTEEMFGYTREELLGQKLRMLLPERVRDIHAQHRAGYFAEPRIRTMGNGMNLSGRRKDGTEFPVEIGLGYTETEDGVLALGLVSDITERKRVEDQLVSANAELKAREEQLHSYLEAASQAIVAVDARGRIQLANGRTVEMFGYTREELLGENLEMLLPERYRGSHAGHRAEYFIEPRVRTMGIGLDLVGRRKDGTEFPVEIGLGYARSAEGMQALGMISDATERKRIENQLVRANAELRVREALTRSYLEAVSQPIVAVGSDGKIQLVNRHLGKMFGYSPEELLGQGLETLLPERYRQSHMMQRGEYFDAPRVRAMGIGMDLVGQRKDGTEFPVEIGLGHVQTEAGTLVLGLVIDITERKRVESELARVNTELTRSNSELAQFAYVASHDLQEPLRMITGYLQLLERRYKTQLNDEAREFIDYAVDGAVRMKNLIQDLLRLSRAGTQSMNFREVEISSLIEAACANLQVALEESGAEMTVDPLPKLTVDAGLLTQVFQNLIGNALKFRTAGVPPHIHVGAAEAPGGWVFSVRDNGIGIEPQHYERIFRIFERLHGADQYGGSGVGLAITQRIVERHGGRVWVESKAGEGSTFYFSIPARVGAKIASTGIS